MPPSNTRSCQHAAKHNICAQHAAYRHNVSCQAKLKTKVDSKLNQNRPNKIFKLSNNKDEVKCLPDQVFENSEFEFLITIGGDLAEDEKEYDKFTKLLKKLGEDEFYIYENIGATITDREIPYQTIIDINDNYEIFQKKVNSFESNFGWSINHFFIYGQNIDWGIYISEFPCINIIGCKIGLQNSFRNVFSIIGNGYLKEKEFIKREFGSNKPHLLKQLEKEYKLEKHND